MKESRIKEMADYISKFEQVRLDSLAEKFDVSIYTVRRDIDELAKKGIVSKNYGGVSIVKDETQLIDFSDRNTVHKEEKKAISKKAASLIEDGDIVYIDGGTTTLYIPDFIAEKDVTIVTNNVFVVMKVLRMKNVKLIVLGGEFDRRSSSISGLTTIECLKNINLTKAFISCTGVSKDYQVTNYTAVEAELKRVCMNKSNLSYLLAHHSKFGVASLVTYASLKQFDGIITSNQLNEHFKEHIKENNVICLCDE